MKKIGLYFGTFNPIHVGHLIIANYMADYTELDEVWLVVSPQNPLKKKETLLKDHHRLSLVRIALEDNTKLMASNIEFDLPIPSYTINTLVHLKEKYETYEFHLIMGEDNLRSFHKWKNQEEIINNHKIFVYPRVLTEQEMEDNTIEFSSFNHSNVIRCQAPIMKISSSFIRKAIKNGKDVRYLLTPEVFKYVDEMNFYK
ncbi:MAG: nicotinate (nicotinamide) nucleotide adenylyltransferase [Bacteroidota bacterium]|nr:nicotinate (nicotinamide) nucleotide adenylyltransferase [Bacteroidota bacterium]|tara:strand:+ start:493 stop:1092 length:600 start_codon:yes stop_codon:yes gene_type:complete